MAYENFFNKLKIQYFIVLSINPKKLLFFKLCVRVIKKFQIK